MTNTREEYNRLQCRLGLGSATAAVAGEAIAVGIFLTPAGMAKALGSPMWLLFVWLLIGGMTLSGALCYGELAGRFPRTGGTYVYLKEAFGQRTAFLYGWMSLVVLDPGLTAALATGSAGYASYIFHWSPLTVKCAAIVLITALCILNCVSVRITAGVLRWMTWLKFGVLGLLAAWAFIFHLGSWNNFVPAVAQHPGSLPLASGLAASMVAAFFSFGGWWDVSKLAGEVRDAAHTLPRAMALGVSAVTLVYILISALFLYLVPLEKITSDQTFVAQAGAAMFGPAGGSTFAALVVLCVVGSMAAFMMSAPRVYYAMAQEGIFLEAVTRLHPRFGTPWIAITIQGFIASLLVVLGDFQHIIAYFIFSAVAFLGLAVAGLFVFRRKAANNADLILAPGYPATPIVFIALIMIMLVLIAMHDPRESLLGTLVVMAGLPAYSIFQHNLKTGRV